MTVEELEEKIAKKEQSIAMGFTHDEMSFQTIRDCKGERLRVAPGIYGRIVQWGGKDSPTIFMVQLADAKKWLEKLKSN